MTEVSGHSRASFSRRRSSALSLTSLGAVTSSPNVRLPLMILREAQGEGQIRKKPKCQLLFAMLYDKVQAADGTDVPPHGVLFAPASPCALHAPDPHSPTTTPFKQRPLNTSEPSQSKRNRTSTYLYCSPISRSKSTSSTQTTSSASFKTAARIFFTPESIERCSGSNGGG